jgi:hypothetical protein
MADLQVNHGRLAEGDEHTLVAAQIIPQPFEAVKEKMEAA